MVKKKKKYEWSKSIDGPQLNWFHLKKKKKLDLKMKILIKNGH